MALLWLGTMSAQTGIEIDGGMIDHKNASAVLSQRATPLDIAPISVILPVSGAGTRLMWIPEKSAFRAGTVLGTQWDDTNLGTWSFAFGFNAIASGNYSSALGESTVSSGIRSFSTGYLTSAIGQSSSALGASTVASGIFSTAMGGSTIASGVYSTAMGSGTTASGEYSTAMGQSTKANSFGSAAMGRFNDTISGSSQVFWIPTDPLLTIGNGSNNAARSNAVTVYKNGNTDIQGYARLGTSAEGAPRIKVKKLTSTTDSSNTGNQFIAHGLNLAKIVSIDVMVETISNTVLTPPGYVLLPQYTYYFHVNATNVVVQNQASSCAAGDHICSKPVRILITYEE